MKTSTLFASLLSFASFTTSLHAIPAVVGDLILGFRAGSSPGSETNLEVNLGPASAFYGAASGTTSVLTRLAVQDLIETYGANWNTRTDLSWGLIGTTGTSTNTGAPARTIWASAPESTPGTASTPWTRASSSGLQNSSNAIATMYGTGAPGSLGNFPATTNSAFSAKVLATSAGSWTVQEDLVASQSFRRFTPTVRQAGNTFPVAGSGYDGTGYSVLDLYDMRPTLASDPPGLPATLVGGFGLNSAGKLVFSTDITRFAPPTAGAELGIPTITYIAGTVTVSLANVPPGSYILERSTTLAALSWTTLFTQSPVAGVLTYTDGNPPPLRGFYRIKKSS